MDAALLVLALIFALLVIGCAFYFVLYFEHPQDRWTSWVARVIAITGFSFTCYNVLLLPMDVANQNGSYNATGGLPMAQIESIFFMISAIIAWVFIPFAVIHYESMVVDNDDDSKEKKSSSQLLKASLWSLPWVIAAALLVFLCYYFIGSANIGVQGLTSAFVSGALDTTGGSYCNSTQNCYAIGISSSVYVDPFVYTISLTTLLGWVFLIVFGGYGLIALPLDLVLEFMNRPKNITKSEFERGKLLIGEMAQDLLQEKMRMDEDKFQQARSTFSGADYLRFQTAIRSREAKFIKDVTKLDNMYRDLRDAFDINGVNAVWVLTKFCFGILGCMLTLLWFIHTLIYVIPVEFGDTAPTVFLNSVFSTLSSVPFFGPVVYGLFVFYLLLATIKGAASLSERIPLLNIHPIRLGETLMSSLLVNICLSLFASLAVAQFCAVAFQVYASFTAISSIMGLQVQNLQYIGQAFQYLPIALVASMVGSSVYYGVLLSRKKENPHQQKLQQLLRKAEKRNKAKANDDA